MKRLTALLLILALLLGISSSALARRKTYTLDIFWVANKDDEAVRTEVEEAINEYLGTLYDNRVIRYNLNVSFHLIGWDEWMDEVIGSEEKPGALMRGDKIDLLFTADWEGYVQEASSDWLQPIGMELLEEHGQGILDSLSEDFLEGVKYNQAIYGIPTNKELCVPTGLIVNKTAAELIGWDPDKDPVKSTEELEPYLAKYKEMFPGRYPYLMENGRWSDEPWDHDWIGIEGDALAMKFAKNEDGEFDETVYSIYETDEQKAHIELMYKWAQLGYIAPDAASYNYNKIFGTGDFLVYTQPLKGNGIKTVEMMAANKVSYADFSCTEIILQDKYKVTSQAGGSMFAIPKTGRPDEAMTYLNLMHSDPVLVNLMLFGREGVHYKKVNDTQVEKIDDEHWWYGMHGGAWTVGNTTLQYVLTSEDPAKNKMLQEYANDAPKTASFGFRFNKKSVAETLGAVETVVKAFWMPLMVGAVDPEDPERGLEAFRKALKEAGMDELKAEVEAQYETWKTSLK